MRRLLLLSAITVVLIASLLIEDQRALAVDVQAVSAGPEHTCSLMSDGSVRCWGRNHDGQLGDASTTDTLTPLTVCADSACATLLTSTTAISTGGASGFGHGGHTCAIVGGGLKCWGRNAEGQLGIGASGGHSTIPVEPIGLDTGVTSVTLGDGHTCARVSSGGVKCWGNNLRGQLGDGTSNDRNEPVDVTGLTSNVAGVWANGRHTCAVTESAGLSAGAACYRGGQQVRLTP